MRTLVDGVARDHVAVADRGFGYGDGLFETVLFVNGRAPLWARHMQRLLDGCLRLALPPPPLDRLAAEAAALVDGLPRAVVRITWTRGGGERGYAPPSQPAPTRVVAAFAADAPAADWYARGIRVRCCALRLAEQPLLAGLKHLNRLEQVLARAEWSGEGIVEGLLADVAGRVIGATAANLFVVHGGCVATPDLRRCGVAGVARAEVLARFPEVQVRDIGMDEIMTADEIFLSNAVRGIVPVAALDARHWAVGPRTRAVQAHWVALGLLPPEAA